MIEFGAQFEGRIAKFGRFMEFRKFTFVRKENVALSASSDKSLNRRSGDPVYTFALKVEVEARLKIGVDSKRAVRRRDVIFGLAGTRSYSYSALKGQKLFVCEYKVN